MKIPLQKILLPIVSLFVLSGGIMQAADYYVHPALGLDDNEGTKEKPWKSITKAVSDPKIAPGDTVYLRGGDYYEIGMRLDKSGSAGKPITIRNYPGETPVLYGTDPVYTKVPNKEWELVDKEKNIYKSVQEWDGYPLGSMYQTGSPAKWYALIPYWDNPATPENESERLQSDNEYYSNTTGYYAGPGFYWNPADKKVYIRLSYPKADVTDRPLDLTHSLNPNEVPLYMAKVQTGNLVNAFNFWNANYIDFIGLKFVGLGSPFTYPGAAFHIWTGSHLNFKDISVSGATTAIVMRKATNIVMDNIFKDGHLPPYLAWNDAKSGPAVSMFLGGSDGISGSGNCTNIEIKNSTLVNCFDGIKINSSPTSPSHDFKIHHNEFRNIRDDSISMSTGAWNVEIFDNKFINVSKSISREGGGAHTDHPIGNIYIHHNIVDIGTMLQTRRRSESEPAQHANHVPFGAHAIGNPNVKDTAQPWKIYHNTVSVTAPIAGDNGLGYEYVGVQKIYTNPNDLKEAHEVYNNIFIVKGDWFFGRNSHVDSGQEAYDGNIYWKIATENKKPFANPIYNKAATPSTKAFKDLESFKKDEWYAVTKTYYPPGWENSGVEGDPQLDAEFYPIAGSLGSTPGVDLTAKKWPGTAETPNRGALPPRKK